MLYLLFLRQRNWKTIVQKNKFGSHLNRVPRSWPADFCQKSSRPNLVKIFAGSCQDLNHFRRFLKWIFPIHNFIAKHFRWNFFIKLSIIWIKESNFIILFIFLTICSILMNLDKNGVWLVLTKMIHKIFLPFYILDSYDIL